MKLQQQAAAGIAVVDALVVVSTVLPGAPLLPTWMAIVACAMTVAVFVLTVARKGTLRVNGLKLVFRLLKEALPAWAIILAAVGFYGGWIIALITLASGATAGNLKYENGQYTTSHRKVVRVLTREQYEAAQAANQRTFCAAAMAIASGGVVFGAIRSAAEGPRPRA